MSVPAALCLLISIAGGFWHGVLVARWRRSRSWPRRTCVWSAETRTDMHGAGRAGRVERLFEYRG